MYQNLGNMSILSQQQKNNSPKGLTDYRPFLDLTCNEGRPIQEISKGIIGKNETISRPDAICQEGGERRAGCDTDLTGPVRHNMEEMTCRYFSYFAT